MVNTKLILLGDLQSALSPQSPQLVHSSDAFEKFEIFLLRTSAVLNIEQVFLITDSITDWAVQALVGQMVTMMQMLTMMAMVTMVAMM